MKIQTYQPLVWKETLSGRTSIGVLWFYFGVAQEKQVSYAAFQGERVLKKYHFHCIKSDQAGLNGNRIRTDQCAIVIHSG